MRPVGRKPWSAAGRALGRAVLIGVLAAAGCARPAAPWALGVDHGQVAAVRLAGPFEPEGATEADRPLAPSAAGPRAGPVPADGSAVALSVAGSAGLAEQHASATLSEMEQASAEPGGASAPDLDRAESPEDEAPPAGLAVPGALSQAISALAAPSAFNLAASPGAYASFGAVEDDNSIIPPDTSGAAGPRHLMVTLNNRVRVQDRKGQTLSTLSLNQFWHSVNGGSGSFDPRVLYDPYAGRWIIVACDDSRSSSSAILVGVSQSDDPTAGWNLYRLDADPSHQTWADFPSVGFNGKWIVVQANLYNIAEPGSFSQAGFWALDKADLYAGGSGRYSSFAVTGIGGTVVPASTYDASLPDLYLLQNWNGDYNGQGYLRLWKLSGAVGAEAINDVGFVPVSEPWADYSLGGAEIAPQTGSARNIVVDDARLSSLVFRDGSLWAAQMVLLPAQAPTRSAVQWWQLTPAGAVMQRGRVDDAAGGVFYAYPSLAVNRDGTALLGYSRFSADAYASAYYALRLPSDPLGTLRTEQPLKAGQAPYVKTFGGTNRWGDYSATTIDPLDDSGFWTIQEYAAAPVNGWDQWGTWWGHVLAPNTPPSLSAPGEQYLDNSRPAQIAVAVDNADRPLAALVLSAASSDEALLPASQMIVSGQGAQRTLTINPLAGVAGQVDVTLTASDGALSASQVLTVHVGRLADLSISNSDGREFATAGQALTYTVVIRNAGPNDVVGAAVSDVLPSGFVQAAWACATSNGAICAASGTGNLQASAVNLPSGGVMTYTVGGVVAGPASGLLTSSASVSAPSDWVDPPGNNSAVDSTVVGYVVFVPVVRR